MNVREAIVTYPYMVDEIKDLEEKFIDAINRRDTLKEASIKANKLNGLPHGTDVSNPVLDMVIKFIDEYDKEILEIGKKKQELKKWKVHLDKEIKTLKEIEKDMFSNLQSYGFDNMKKIRDRMYIGIPGYYSIVKRVIKKLDMIA